MDFHAPPSWADALALRAAHPTVLPVAGGTDVLAAFGAGAPRPSGLLDLSRVSALRRWSRGADGRVRIGAGVTHARVLDELGAILPGLAAAVRTIGSPQIRNRGTLGGNLATASPSGDSHPALIAAFAEVELVSVRGSRTVPVAEYLTGPGRSLLAPDELIAAVLVRPPSGPQQFATVGARRAMSRTVSSFALALYPDEGRVGTGIGAAAPTARPATAAATHLAAGLAAAGLWRSRGPLPDGLVTEFARLVAAATDPADERAGRAAYRRHAVGVLARRTLDRAWRAYCATASCDSALPMRHRQPEWHGVLVRQHELCGRAGESSRIDVRQVVASPTVDRAHRPPETSSRVPVT